MEFSLAEVHDAIADAIPEREALVFRDRRLSYGDLRDRSRRLANYLLSRGLEVRAERSGLAGHESGQDHLAIYCYNGNEYVVQGEGRFRSREDISSVVVRQDDGVPVVVSDLGEVVVGEAPSRGEASVRAVRCSVRPVDGGVSLRAEIDMPRAGAEEEAVVESGQPTVWAAEPQTRREGGTLVTETKLMHMDGKPFMLDRSRLRFTVLGSEHAVDIQGCDS